MTSKQDMHEVACHILLALGPSQARHAYDVASHADWWNYLPKGVDPNAFTNADDYFLSAVAHGLFKKYEDFPGSASARRAAALVKWHEAEKQCFRTNRRFDDYLREGPLFSELPSRIREFLASVKKECHSIIGRVPNEIDPHFGPGATFETRGIYACAVPSKIGNIPSMTIGAWPMLSDWSRTGWAQNLASTGGSQFGAVLKPTSIQDETRLQTAIADGALRYKNGVRISPMVVRGNRYETVPKNMYLDRSIGIEPSLNVFYQLGYGAHLKKVLNRYGQLLVPREDSITGQSIGADSKQIHMELARIGSITGELATIDLSAASDTVAFSVVEYLLPPQWFSVLSSLRSPTTTIDGEVFHLEKFSSMGNGYTFELETLIFLSICRCVLRSLGVNPSEVKTFGDDIIVPTSCYDSTIAALRFFGFTPNTSKSFGSGPFRESCGGDFFRGVDVRPPSIKGEPSSPLDWIVIHNQLKRLEGRVIDYHLGNALNVCIRNIPVACRLYGPQGLGDAVLHGDKPWTLKMRSYRNPHVLGRGGSKIWHIRAITGTPRKLSWARWDWSSAAYSRLYGIQGSCVSLRGEPDGYAVRWIPLTGVASPPAVKILP